MMRMRSWMRAHGWLAMMIVVMALCLRAFIPQGMMIGSASTLLTVQICSDGSSTDTVQIAVPRNTAGDGAGGDHDGRSGDHATPCAFSSLAMDALGGADALVLAVAIAFVMALGFAPVTSVLRAPLSYLRPPLRGPPVRLIA